MGFARDAPMEHIYCTPPMKERKNPQKRENYSSFSRALLLSLSLSSSKLRCVCLTHSWIPPSPPKRISRIHRISRISSMIYEISIQWNDKQRTRTEEGREWSFFLSLSFSLLPPPPPFFLSPPPRPLVNSILQMFRTQESLENLQNPRQ